MKPLARSFYSRPVLTVARALLGRTLLHDSPEGHVAGRIVEVEAYGGSNDPGSHAHRGMTPRNTTMFGPPGHLYVYFTYGMHWCSNVVSEKDGVPGAVLLRAVEPLEGIELMAARRGTDDPRLLARGPARLCQAFGFARAEDGADLVSGPIWIGGRQRIQGTSAESARIGVRIGAEHIWRFYEPGPWVSGSRNIRARSRG